MGNHLGYTMHDPKGHNSGNSRNGKGKKAIKFHAIALVVIGV
jgi:hypothetical protein